MVIILAIGIVFAHIVGYNITEIATVTTEPEDPDPHLITLYGLLF
ncbi:MAG: hypothetical protein ACTJHC_01415 [Vagococcus sp.]